MNRSQIEQDVDSARVVHGSAGALFAAAFIIICAVFWHSRAGAAPSVDVMDDSKLSMVFHAVQSSAFTLN